ncbi:MAG: DUF4954 family protein [Rikenellaceae bacterium]
MGNLRNISCEERELLGQRGCYAESWDQILVSEDFCVDQLLNVRFAGSVTIESGAKIIGSHVANYIIGEGAVIDGVERLECRKESTFANGVEVASINENGGRKILIYDELRAQTAYIWAMYRNHTTMCDRLTKMVEEYADRHRSTIGKVGRGSKIIASKLIREVDVREAVVIEGASQIECATLLSGSFVGVDVKLREVIVAEDARVDTGATLERCFVGERAIVASMFSALDSLIFASSHLENGEAASIFAGPYTVSHHKSTLLIAGLFSFFNAGSASNQSNHLFKCGPVHQAIHPRGCKFASGAYIMAPAREGAFTMVKGYHAKHHDTEAFPYSYLIDDGGGRSMLMPGANLVSYGTKRDIEKWRLRDKRVRYRDVINYEEHNPYLVGAMVRAVNTLHTLSDANPDADEYMWERTVIRKSQLRRGVGFYNKAIAAAIGAMLSRGHDYGDNIEGDWADVAGAYVPMSTIKDIIFRVESGEISSLTQIDREFAEVGARYDDLTHSWARSLLAQLMGATPTEEQIASTIESSKGSAEDLERQRVSDMNRDNSLNMAVGYGNDSHDEAVRESDFRAVRGLN